MARALESMEDAKLQRGNCPELSTWDPFGRRGHLAIARGSRVPLVQLNLQCKNDLAHSRGPFDLDEKLRVLVEAVLYEHGSVGGC